MVKHEVLHNIAFTPFRNSVLRNPYIKGFIQQDEHHKTMANCIVLSFHANLLKTTISKVTATGVEKTKKETVTSIMVVSVFSRRLTCRKAAI